MSTVISSTDITNIEPGKTRVTHSEFGEGTVTKIDSPVVVEVKFDTAKTPLKVDVTLLKISPTTETEKIKELRRDKWPTQTVNVGSFPPGTLAYSLNTSKHDIDILSSLEVISSWDTLDSVTQNRLIDSIINVLKQEINIKAAYSIMLDEKTGNVKDVTINKDVKIYPIDISQSLFDIVSNDTDMSELSESALIELLNDIPVTTWQEHPIDIIEQVKNINLHFRLYINYFDDTLVYFRDLNLVDFKEE